MKLDYVCPRRFDAMQGVPGGRHCRACDETVRDMRDATAAEIRAHRAQGRCGHYLATPGGQIASRPVLMTALALALASCEAAGVDTVGVDTGVDTGMIETADTAMWHPPSHAPSAVHARLEPAGADPVGPNEPVSSEVSPGPVITRDRVRRVMHRVLRVLGPAGSRRLETAVATVLGDAFDEHRVAERVEQLFREVDDDFEPEFVPVSSRLMTGF